MIYSALFSICKRFSKKNELVLSNDIDCSKKTGAKGLKKRKKKYCKYDGSFLGA